MLQAHRWTRPDQPPRYPTIPVPEHSVDVRGTRIAAERVAQAGKLRELAFRADVPRRLRSFFAGAADRLESLSKSHHQVRPSELLVIVPVEAGCRSLGKTLEDVARSIERIRPENTSFTPTVLVTLKGPTEPQRLALSEWARSNTRVSLAKPGARLSIAAPHGSYPVHVEALTNTHLSSLGLAEQLVAQRGLYPEHVAVIEPGVALRGHELWSLLEARREGAAAAAPQLAYRAPSGEVLHPLLKHFNRVHGQVGAQSLTAPVFVADATLMFVLRDAASRLLPEVGNARELIGAALRLMGEKTVVSSSAAMEFTVPTRGQRETCIGYRVQTRELGELLGPNLQATVGIDGLWPKPPRLVESLVKGMRLDAWVDSLPVIGPAHALAEIDAAAAQQLAKPTLSS
ncbi:MAG: hypothetical protein ACKVPX_05185 [Myxococcaceae bacterium]